MRLDAPDQVAPDFVDDMMRVSDGRGDPAYFRTLAEQAPATMRWLGHHGITFCSPPYYLAAGPRRIQPVGGGRTIVETLARSAKSLGVEFHYERTARRLVLADNERIAGVAAVSDDGKAEIFSADAAVLATGGFQASGDMMRSHFGAGGETFAPISPGTRYNTGDGIRMAMEHGAQTAGDWKGAHAEPVDPRSKNSAPVVLVYPYGIVVDRNGRRFFDEGGGLMHETWEHLARKIHFDTPGGIAYAILDRRVFDIPGHERAVRSEMPPYKADSLEGLAKLIGIDAQSLAATVTAYNAAATGDPARFDATRCDGLAASTALDPPKSNWARALVEPPFLAYPLIGAIAYTFGGLATNAKAEVLGKDGPLPGLYAAGEITGHFHGTAPNAVSVTRALVFGRIAGLEAVAYVERRPPH